MRRKVDIGMIRIRTNKLVGKGKQRSTAMKKAWKEYKDWTRSGIAISPHNFGIYGFNKRKKG